MAFQLPTKGDLDRGLSLLMHDARHKLMIEKNRIIAEASMAGASGGNRVIVSVASFADQIHDASMKQATPMLLDYIERIKLPPAEITEWVRPHLENLGNSLIGLIPPNGFPADHKRIVTQYQAVFKQRLDGVLRDVEIGFVKGAGFARADQLENKEHWVTPSRALELLQFTLGHGTATLAICARANDGMIRARADRYMEDGRVADNVEIPAKFWWARGEAALTQNWRTGDFETWIAHRIHLKAYGVRFLQSDIEKMIPDDDKAARRSATPPSPGPTPIATPGGRLPADWWDDLWIEVCRQLYDGDLAPKKQADIENAMLKWLSEARNENPSVSTIRPRARKLWQAINKDKN
jgi:hypothetical protein